MEKKSQGDQKGIEEEEEEEEGSSQTRPLCEALFSLTCTPLCENMKIQLVLQFSPSTSPDCLSNLRVNCSQIKSARKCLPRMIQSILSNLQKPLSYYDFLCRHGLMNKNTFDKVR